MKKIVLFIGLFMFIFIISCEKTEEGNKLVGTWELTDSGGLPWYDEPQYWIFTKDDHYHILYEDDFGIRDIWSRIYCIVDDVLSSDFELYRFTIDNNTATFEIPYNGKFYIVTFTKVADIDYDTWLTDIELGSPLFTSTFDEQVDGLAWTGQRLWVVDWPWSSRLAEIDINDGDVLQSMSVSNCHGSIAYGNNTLITGYSGALYFKDPVNGSQTGNIPIGSTYGTVDAITYDGSNIWFYARLDQGYDFALAKCDFSGNIIQSATFYSGVDDLAYGNGFIWIAIYDNIVKFDPDTWQAVENYQIQDITLSGGNLSLEFINGQLWVVDDRNNFYIANIS